MVARCVYCCGSPPKDYFDFELNHHLPGPAKVVDQARSKSKYGPGNISGFAQQSKAFFHLRL
jgi:hypothetical protein